VFALELFITRNLSWIIHLYCLCVYILRYLWNLLKLDFLLVRPKLEYASVAWNSVTANDAGKLERIQCFVIVFSTATYSTTTSVPEVTRNFMPKCSESSPGHSLLLYVYIGSKCLPLRGNWRPSCAQSKFQSFYFDVGLERLNCPSGRCDSTAMPSVGILVYSAEGLFCVMICYDNYATCPFRINASFYGEELLAPRPTVKLEDHTLSAVRDCVFSIFATSVRIGGRPSIRSLRTRHAVVAGNPWSWNYATYRF